MKDGNLTKSEIYVILDNSDGRWDIALVRYEGEFESVHCKEVNKILTPKKVIEFIKGKIELE